MEELYIVTIYFEEFSTAMFKTNVADYGGAVLAEVYSHNTFSDNSTIEFTKNKANFGTTTYSTDNSKLIVKGNSTVLFDDFSEKWYSNTCLPYHGQSDTVTIDSNGTVWCSNQEAFVYLNKKYYCKNL